MTDLFFVVLITISASILSAVLVMIVAGIRLYSQGVPFRVHDVKGFISQVMHPSRAVRDNAVVYIGIKLTMNDINILTQYRLLMISMMNKGTVNDRAHAVILRVLNQITGHARLKEAEYAEAFETV